MRQHYIPVSFLKRWADDKEEIVRYGMLRGRLLADKKNPDKVCYVKDGWTLGNEIRPEHRAFVEKQMTGIVDTKAAAAFRRIDSYGIDNISAEDAFTVMSFCSSLIVRSQTALSLIGSAASDELVKILIEQHSQIADDDPLKEQYRDPVATTRRNFPGLIENIGKLMLPKLAYSSRLVEILKNRQWCLFDFSRTSVGTIPLPDTGLIAIGGGIDSKDSVLALPIDPRKVLYFASAENIDRIVGVGSGRLAIATIESAVNMARMFVFGDMNVNPNILERQFRTKSSS